MVNGTCRNGLLVPALPTTPGNSFLYLASLLYCFLGIAIAADIFMCAIEQITSATRKIKKKKSGALVASDSEDEYEEVRIWNPTVANLTLMALGSSAPEILLSIIEIVGNDFKAGALGPGTIVGSAAFNLLGITAICVLAVPSPEAKKIHLYRVFIVTATFGTFAYVWLLLILTVTSPNVVEVWEAVVTLALFFILIIVAYVVDQQVWKSKGADLARELEMEETDEKIHPLESSGPEDPGYAPTYESVKKWTRHISKVYPSLSDEDQAKLLAYRINKNKPHDRLSYRIQACRLMSSSWKKSRDEEDVEKIEMTEVDSKHKHTYIEFSARVYAVTQDAKEIVLKVIRKGNLTEKSVVNVVTVNGVAKKDLHFLFKSKTIQFAAGEREKNFRIELIEGAVWHPNDVFYVHLKIQDADESRLGDCNVARVRFPDDTSLMKQSSVEFVKPNYVVKESSKRVRLFVTRRGNGLNTPVKVFYETLALTATEGDDYIGVKDGVVHFEGHEYEKYIDITIVDDKEDEKDENFMVEMIKTDNSDVLLGGKKRTTVTIISDDNVVRNITNVHKLMGHYLRKMTPGKATWREQILNAVSVNGGDIANATIVDCILHAISFPWKFTLAFLPPPTILHGYPCFLVALAVIGLITAVVGDLASIFGCMVGLPDAVTAITLVAIGTSLPDTFASKIAAENDEHADNAIGNVTGSNSVNVFLGLGLPWLFASLYWASKGQVFEVNAGDLGFSVSVFMACSVLLLIVLVMRRMVATLGEGELGGPICAKIMSALFFFFLWVVYIVASVLNSMQKK